MLKYFPKEKCGALEFSEQMCLVWAQLSMLGMEKSKKHGCCIWRKIIAHNEHKAGFSNTLRYLYKQYQDNYEKSRQ